MPPLINGSYAYDIFDNYPHAIAEADHPMTLTSLSGHTWWTHDGVGSWTWKEHAMAGNYPDVDFMWADPTGWVYSSTPHAVALLDAGVYNARVILGVTGPAAGAAFRCTHDMSDWDGYYTDFQPVTGPDGLMRIIKRESGLETVVATSGTIAMNGFAGRECNVLEVRMLGSTITVFVDAALVLTYVDSFNISATHFGMVSSAATDGGLRYAGLFDIYVRPPLVPVVCGAMDICFVLDRTGSMGASIANIKSGVLAIMDDIEFASGGDYRLALITVDDPIEVIENFAPTNRTAIEAGVAAIPDLGEGRGLPEATDEAIHTALILRNAADCPPLSYYYIYPGHGPDPVNNGQWGDFNVAWRPTVIKILVLVTDAAPGGFDDLCTWDVDLPRAASFAVMAAAQAVRIVSIMVPDNDRLYLWTRGVSYPGHDYSDISHGVFGRIATSGLGATEAIREAILACGGVIVRPPTLAQIAG